MIPFYAVWDGEKPEAGDPWYKDLTPNVSPCWQRIFDVELIVSQFKRLDPSTPKPGGKKHGHSYSSYILNAPRYLAYLSSLCAKQRIPIIRQRLSSLDEAYNLPAVGPVDLVVNATGLGARWLPGVEDSKVYPAKGQTVLVKAPGVKTCYMAVEGGFNVVPGQVTDREPSSPSVILKTRRCTESV